MNSTKHKTGRKAFFHCSHKLEKAIKSQYYLIIKIVIMVIIVTIVIMIEIILMTMIIVIIMIEIILMTMKKIGM